MHFLKTVSDTPLDFFSINLGSLFKFILSLYPRTKTQVTYSDIFVPHSFSLFLITSNYILEGGNVKNAFILVGDSSVNQDENSEWLLVEYSVFEVITTNICTMANFFPL